MEQIILETLLKSWKSMEDKKVVGDNQHGFTEGKFCYQPGAEECLLPWLGPVIPLTNFLGGCTQPFLQQNVQFATYFFCQVGFFFFLRILIPLFGN